MHEVDGSLLLGLAETAPRMIVKGRLNHLIVALVEL